MLYSSDPIRRLHAVLAEQPDLSARAAAARVGVREAAAAYMLAQARRRRPGQGAAAAALAELLEFVAGCEADWRLDDRIRSARP